MRTLIAAAVLLLVPVSSAWAGNGRFGAGPEISVPKAASVAVGDFNADGRADLAAMSSTGHVVVRLGRAGGGFDARGKVDVSGTPTEVVVADFNGDGNEDLAVANQQLVNQTQYRINVRLGAGDGRFDYATDFVVAMLPQGLVVGDFNGDGRDDLAIATESTAGFVLAVRLGSGDGKFTVGGDIVGRANSLGVGDFNSDGNEDLVFGSRGPQPSGVLIGTGGGAFTAGADIALNQGTRTPWAVGDFDADGRQDVAAPLPDLGVVAVRLGAGDGTFRAAPDVRVGTRPYMVAAGDVDSDGHEDLLAANGEGIVSVRLGDGDGRFRAAPDVPAGEGPASLALGDFDGDGNDDLAVANYSGGSVSVRHGLGTPPLAGNLLVNGGFEGPGAAPLRTRSAAIPGWQHTGGMTFVRYGLPSHAFFPSRVAAPRYGSGGLNLLWGGRSAETGGVTEASQTVGVGGSPEAIDAGRATAGLSAHLGGALAFGDRMAARADFLSAGGGTLGSFTIGPVTAADRGRLTTLVRRTKRAPVPDGTRRIRVTLTSTDDDKSYSSAVADNVELRLDVRAATSRPAFGRDTRVKLALAGKRLKAGRPVTVRVTNGNSFVVTGSLRARSASGIALRTRRLRIAANGSEAVRLRVPKPLHRRLARRRRLALRLTALVRDPAGNVRTVRRQVRLRR